MSKLVNFQGQTIRDDDLETCRHEERKFSRDGEPFTASTDCPECGVMDVHWLDKPRAPAKLDTADTAAQAGIKLINRANEYMWAMLGIDPYDAPGTVVARVCKSCGYRWGQK